MARWYLVRHGETDWNVERRIQGHADVPLNDAGRREAALAARRLAREHFAAAYASDLSRTWETARIILDALPADERPELRPASSLREVHVGVYEGKTSDEVRSMDPTVEDRRADMRLDFAADGGESYRQLLQRVGGFGEALERDHAGDDVLVVAHSGSLRALAVRLLGLPDDALWRLRGMRSAGISIVQREGGPPALVAWNDACHLL